MPNYQLVYRIGDTTAARTFMVDGDIEAARGVARTYIEQLERERGAKASYVSVKAASGLHQSVAQPRPLPSVPPPSRNGDE